MSGELPAGLEAVLESAARLQQMVPDTVLVGGTAAAYYARHRMSTDHDHVMEDLRERFDIVLEALEREGDFVLNRVTPGKIILGELGGIETGIRQMIRTRPLEVQRIQLRSGMFVTVPTLAEMLRIKAFLIVKRNQMRDYLDVAALSGKFGSETVGSMLTEIDNFYTDPAHAADRPAQAQLARQLAQPEPKDHSRTARLPGYKSLTPRWHTWDAVVAECRTLATHLI